jgi:SAM-dependent methyltransferase
MRQFDKMSVVYDSSIDWQARLEREIPFVLKCLPASRRARVLDMACGSGRHSIALAQRGFEVVGFDNSVEMIRIARTLADKEGAKPELLVGDMLKVKGFVNPAFDLVICLGNSLALLPSQDAVRDVVSSVHSLLSSGGFFIFQVLNFEEIRKSGFRFFPVKTGTTQEGYEVIFLRFFDHSERQPVSTLVMTGLTNTRGQWSSEVTTLQILNFDFEFLQDAMSSSGFTKADFFSDYQGATFSKAKSRDLIVLARI